MNTEKTTPAKVRHSLAGLIAPLLFVVVAIGVGLWCAFGDKPPAALLESVGTRAPEIFVPLMVLLPLFGFPLAPFYLFAGLTYGFGEAFALCLVSLAIHLALAYPFYGRMLRRPVLALFTSRGYAPPRLTEKNRLRVTVLVASVPALPFWAQNATLAVAGTPFFLYYAVSLAVQAVFAASLIALGHAGRTHAGTPWIPAVIAVVGTIFGLRALRRMRREAAAAK